MFRVNFCLPGKLCFAQKEFISDFYYIISAHFTLWSCFSYLVPDRKPGIFGLRPLLGGHFPGEHVFQIRENQNENRKHR
jgi:hypothetical protein